MNCAIVLKAPGGGMWRFTDGKGCFISLDCGVRTSVFLGLPIAAVIGKPDTSVLEAVIRDVSDALQPYLDDHGLSFPIENHLTAAVRPSPTADG